MSGENREVLTRTPPPASGSLSYGPGDLHVADVWLPPQRDPAALVLLWHGGFWGAEWDRTHAGPAAASLAAEGFAVATPEYRRVGSDGGWPSTFLDVAAAADLLPGIVREQFPGRVAARVLYAGHSAGGQLALWAALRDALPPTVPGAGPVLVHGVLALAPVLDLVATHANGDPVAEFLGGSPEQVPDAYAWTDPARLGAPRVPVVVVHGDRDIRVAVEHSRRWTRTHGAELVEVVGADHFAVIDPLSTAWPVVLDSARRLGDR